MLYIFWEHESVNDVSEAMNTNLYSSISGRLVTYIGGLRKAKLDELFQKLKHCSLESGCERGYRGDVVQVTE